MQQQYQDSFWTGYYTSRPNFKKFIRDLSSITFTSNSIYSLEWFKDDSLFSISDLVDLSQTMSELLGVMMHHDTITGTSQKRIIAD